MILSPKQSVQLLELVFDNALQILEVGDLWALALEAQSADLQVRGLLLLSLQLHADTCHFLLDKSAVFFEHVTFGENLADYEEKVTAWGVIHAWLAVFVNDEGAITKG